MTARDRGHVEEREPKYKHGDVLYNNNGSKIEIIDIVADQYKFDCGDEYPHYEFFAYIESNYSKEPVSEDEKIRKWIRKELESKYVVDNIVNNGMADKALAWLEKKGEQKPAWSEEDEKQARLIERIVHNDGCTQKLQEQIADWFKALKDRVQLQPKQEWSEEDKGIVTELIGIFESAVDGGHVSFPYRLIKDYIRVLKSCLSQNTWKPSDEQMEALEQVCGIVGNKYKTKVSEIYEQLKKLKRM